MANSDKNNPVDKANKEHYSSGNYDHSDPVKEAANESQYDKDHKRNGQR